VGNVSLIGLDVGTTACKAVVISNEGHLLGKLQKEYSIIKNNGWLELDPIYVWNSIKSLLVKISRLSGTERIEAISVSAMGDTVTPFDNHLNPLYNSILAFDSRALSETQMLNEILGREWIFRVTGMPLHPMYSACKILWLKNNLPEVFEKTSKFMCYEDYILAKLGSEHVISYSSAARTMMLDICSKQWDGKIIDTCGIDMDKLSKPVPSGTVIGEIDRKLAEEVNIDKNVKLVSGGHDQTCGALSSGSIAEGIALDTTGTVEILFVSLRQPNINPLMLSSNICCYPHSYPDMYCAFTQILTAGAAFEWYKDQFGYIDYIDSHKLNMDVYNVIISKMPDKPKNIFFLTHLAGSGTPSMNSNAKGCLYGLTLAVDRYDIARAILEGITYELKINIQILESAIGKKISSIKCTGGGTKSDFWLKLKADITGKEVTALKMAEAGAIGAAILAGYGAGIFSTLKKGIDAVNIPVSTFYPDDVMNELYNERFQNYLIVGRHINELYDLLR